MPNQRAKDKVFVGLFISRDLKAAVAQEAGRQGVSVSELIAAVLARWVRQRRPETLSLAAGPGEGTESVVVQPTIPDDEVWRL